MVDKSTPWRLTGFYGHPDWTKRHESWTLLEHVKKFHPEPWLCIGDFNEVVDPMEKWGGAVRREGQMGKFRTVQEKCGLSDLGYKGSKFTWTNCRHDESFIKERLD